MSRRALVAGVLDVAIVVVFVAIGRREHDEGSAASAIVEVAAPFLIALVVAWLAGRVWTNPLSVRVALMAVFPGTLAIGMLLRRLLFDRGTAPAFVIVAALFLGAGLVGWRAIARLFDDRDQNSTATAGTS